MRIPTTPFSPFSIFADAERVYWEMTFPRREGCPANGKLILDRAVVFSQRGHLRGLFIVMLWLIK